MCGGVWGALTYGRQHSQRESIRSGDMEMGRNRAVHDAEEEMVRSGDPVQ